MANQALNLVQIETHCNTDWDSMAGNDQTRFCTVCRKQVHDLSMMSSDAAERLVCQAAGEICVRFARAPGGEMITLDYQARPKPKRWIWPVAAVTAITTALAGAFLGKSQKPVVMMGALPVTRPTITMGGCTPRPIPPTTLPTTAANQGVCLTDEDDAGKR